MEKKLSRFAKASKPSPIQQLSLLAQESNAINLAEGFPDFPAPLLVKQAAISAINSDLNQYRHVQGICDCVAKNLREMHGLDVDQLTDIAICCGQTEAFAAAMFARRGLSLLEICWRFSESWVADGEERSAEEDSRGSAWHGTEREASDCGYGDLAGGKDEAACVSQVDLDLKETIVMDGSGNVDCPASMVAWGSDTGGSDCGEQGIVRDETPVIRCSQGRSGLTKGGSEHGLYLDAAVRALGDMEGPR
ncbi:hypothetical protein Dimus_016339 [Dionaea muscipula]